MQNARQRTMPTWPWSEVWSWADGAVLVVVVPGPLLIFQVSHCVDYTPGQGTIYCESGLLPGMEATRRTRLLAALLITSCGCHMVPVILAPRARGEGAHDKG